jgi:hypothetical protein
MSPDDRPVRLIFCGCLQHQHHHAGEEIFFYEIIGKKRYVVVVTVRTMSTAVASGHRTVRILATNLSIKSITRESFKLLSSYILPWIAVCCLTGLVLKNNVRFWKTSYREYFKIRL